MYFPASGMTQIRKRFTVQTKKIYSEIFDEPVKRQQHKAKWHSDFLVEL